MVKEILSELLSGLTMSESAYDNYVIDDPRVTSLLSEQNKGLRESLKIAANVLRAQGKSTEVVQQVISKFGPEPYNGLDKAHQNYRLAQSLQRLSVIIGGETALQQIQSLKTYDAQRVCPHGHNVPDENNFCPQCSLIIDGDVYNGCSAEVRKVIAASAKMIAWFKALAATEDDNKTPTVEANVTTSQNTPAQPPTLRTCPVGHPVSDDDNFCPICGAEMASAAANEDLATAEDPAGEPAGDEQYSEAPEEEYILQAEGLDGTLNLLKGKVQLVFASETIEIPIRRISSVLYSEAAVTENGHVQFRSFLEEGTTSMFGRTEANTRMSFSLDEQGDFLAILDDVQAQIDTLDNTDWLYDYGNTEEEAGEETSLEAPMRSAASVPQSAIQPAPPTAAIPAPVTVASPIPISPVSAAITIAEAAGTSGRLQLAPDRVRLIPSSGESRDLPLKLISGIELQPASSGGLQEGFIHLHRLIDDKDLSRAVPSAFASLSTDWAKVEIFQVSFRSEQQPEFVRLKGEIETRMASLDTMATFLTLADILKRLQDLEAEVTKLKSS
jgi:hypothetical protein